ncbi:sporulation protein, partial [Bacillus licheniformis]|nr:sporulation protein [Bacillus licheniformis]
MLKKGMKGIAVTVTASALLLSGCGIFQSDQASEEIDPPQDITYVKEEKEQDKTDKTKDKTED